MITATTLYTLFIIVKTTTFVLVTLLLFISYRAFRRSPNRSLGALTAGLSCIAIGSGITIAGGVLIGVEIAIIFIESTILSIGFGLLVYSIYADQSSVVTHVDPIDDR